MFYEPFQILLTEWTYFTESPQFLNNNKSSKNKLKSKDVF